MKYTVLPPQKSPKLLTAYRPSQSLGEHFNAFINRHNVRGWFEEATPEKVFDDWVYAFAAVMISANHRKAAPTVEKGIVPVKYKRAEPRPIPQTWWDAIIEDCRDAALANAYIKQPLCDAEYLARRTRFLADDPEFVKETQLLQTSIRASAGTDLDASMFSAPIKFNYRDL